MHPSVRASALLPLQLSAAESAGQALGALANGNAGVQSRVREVGGVAMLIQLLGLAIKGTPAQCLSGSPGNQALHPRNPELVDAERYNLIYNIPLWICVFLDYLPSIL